MEIKQSKAENITEQAKSQNALKDIYCISGLGADRRVFQKLKFKFQDFSPKLRLWKVKSKKKYILNKAHFCLIILDFISSISCSLIVAVFFKYVEGKG